MKFGLRLASAALMVALCVSGTADAALFGGSSGGSSGGRPLLGGIFRPHGGSSGGYGSYGSTGGSSGGRILPPLRPVGGSYGSYGSTGGSSGGRGGLFPRRHGSTGGSSGYHAY